MRIVNFGSMNVDHVYHVDHFVQAGETIAADSYQIFAGGKGFNQSIALAKAGASVAHAGKVGKDGQWLVAKLAAENVDTDFLQTVQAPTGHAIIQVTPEGENAIFIFGGANRKLEETDVKRTLNSFSNNDAVLLQNETSAVSEVIDVAHERRMRVFFNPAPVTPEVTNLPLAKVDTLIVNKPEGTALTGKTESERILHTLQDRFPNTAVVLTLGAEGAIYAFGERQVRSHGIAVEAKDTTAAGDTFVGYLVASLSNGNSVANALSMANKAASASVTKQGASDSIPNVKELNE